MNKNKLIFSLFVLISATVSKCDQKINETKEITPRDYYMNLQNKVVFLNQCEKDEKDYTQKKSLLEEKTKEIDKNNKKKKEENEKKYNIKASDINQSPEDLKKELDKVYADLTLTDKAYVACNNHWPKAAIFSGVFLAAALAYKYFSADQDDANDQENEE